jgi:hypothetical protein
VWTRLDFPDEALWSFDLSPADRQALINYGRGGENAKLADHFSAAAHRRADLLSFGAGFMRLRHFPIDALTQAQTERAYLGLGQLLGEPVGQDRQANVITHIRDEQLRPAPGVRKYRTNDRQDFHSDGSDIVGLLCLHPPTGGRGRLADVLPRPGGPRPVRGRAGDQRRPRRAGGPDRGYRARGGLAALQNPLRSQPDGSHPEILLALGTHPAELHLRPTRR